MPKYIVNCEYGAVNDDGEVCIPVEFEREFVTCSKCAVPHNKWTGCPKLNGLITPPDFFCGFGYKDKTEI